MSEEKVLEAVREGAHTRMPVYDGNLQNIVGIVNTKDLFHLFSLRGMIVLDDAMYPPLFVEPDRPISEVLREFRRRRRPMALVRRGDRRPVAGDHHDGRHHRRDRGRNRRRARPAAGAEPGEEEALSAVMGAWELNLSTACAAEVEVMP